MSGDLDLPYEDVPDGPFRIDLDAIACGGVVVRAAAVETVGGVELPAVIFDFKTAAGGEVPPILLALPTVEAMTDLARLVTDAVRSAIRNTWPDRGAP